MAFSLDIPSRPRASLRLFLVTMVLVLPSAVRASRDALSVLVLPAEVHGLPAQDGEDIARSLREELARSPYQVVAAEPDPAQLTACAGDDACLASLGQRLGAQRLISLALAGLGQTRLLRCRLIDTRQGMVLQDLEKTLDPGPPDSPALAAELVQRLFPELSPPTPWYLSWWLWGGVAGAAVLTGVAAVTAALLLQPEPQPSDALRLGEL